MRGAFVVQLRKLTQDNKLEGMAEEVNTGKQAKFHSQDELIEFLRNRFASSQSDDFEKGTNEPQDDCR